MYPSIHPSIHQGCRYVLWQMKQAQTEQSPSYHHIISLIISSWSQHPYTCIDDSNALPHLAPPAYSPLPPPARPHPPPLRYQDSSQPLCSAVSLSCRPRRMNSHLHWEIHCRWWLMNAAMKRQLIIFDYYLWCSWSMPSALSSLDLYIWNRIDGQ